MTPDQHRSPAERRSAYLAAALELRRMAVHAHSPEAHKAFMRLVELYEELAEYSAVTPCASADDVFAPIADATPRRDPGAD
jgi:hypothetical protein